MADHDPLTVFRTAISSSLLPVLLTAASEPSPTLPLAAYISFPQPSSSSINLPKDTPTRYTSRSESRDEFYSIGQLWLAWAERESNVRDYLVKGQAGGVGLVSITDRKGVVEYLSGDGDGAGRVVAKGYDPTAPIDSAASATVEGLPSALEHVDAGPSKGNVLAKRKYEVDLIDREFCRKLRAEEIELRDRNSVLRTSGGGKVNNFQPFLQSVMHERIKALRASLDQAGRGKAQPAPQSQPVYDPSRPAKKAKSSNPVIMIPSSPTSLLTMWNIRKFLEQGTFELSETARQNEALRGNVRAEDMIPIMRHKSGPGGDVSSKYYIVDSVEALQKFGQDAWDRVICVLTTGQDWQFRPYKWPDPKQLFRNVKGVYFQWTNEPVAPTIREWNVIEMRIDKSKRHTDKQVVAEFWRIIDSAKRR